MVNVSKTLNKQYGNQQGAKLLCPLRPVASKYPHGVWESPLSNTPPALQCLASQLFKTQTQTARHITSGRDRKKKMHVTLCRKGVQKCTAAMSSREPALYPPWKMTEGNSKTLQLHRNVLQEQSPPTKP